MGLLARWRAWRQRRREALMWERQWRVAFDGDVLHVTDHTGQSGSIALAEVAEIRIETDDGGPFTADVWWWLLRDGGVPALVWPQGAGGERAVLDRLMTLPGFDFEQTVLAQGSTEVARFVVWRRPEPSPSPASPR